MPSSSRVTPSTAEDSSIVHPSNEYPACSIAGAIANAEEGVLSVFLYFTLAGGVTPLGGSFAPPAEVSPVQA